MITKSLLLFQSSMKQRPIQHQQLRQRRDLKINKTMTNIVIQFLIFIILLVMLIYIYLYHYYL